MPDPEFDLYVSLLARLLQLSQDQKRQIEHEFRDHFEERLNDLLQRGLPRATAVRQAIDEFGDAAGLARELTHLSRRKLRRSLMRYTIATAAIGAAILLTINAFIPEHAGIPAPADAQAQAPGETSPQEVAAEHDAAADSTIPEIVWIDPADFVPEPLARPIELDLQDSRLDETLRSIAGQIQVPMLLDVQALRDQGLAADAPVSVRAAQEPAYVVLDRLLDWVHDVPLAWTFQDGILQVTTKDIADERLITISYDVSDLLARGYTIEALANTIQEQTEGPWFGLDGIGGLISVFGDQLMIRQTQRVHRESAVLLAALRVEARERRFSPEKLDRLFEEQLNRKIALDVHEQPLAEVIARINKECGTDLQLDLRSLGEQGVQPDHPVTLTLPELSLRTALEYLFTYVPALNCALIQKHGQLVLVSRDEAWETLEIVVHDVSDIVGDSPDGALMLIDLIENETEGLWFNLDGIGGLIFSPRTGILIVRTSQQTQHEVRELIAEQRRIAERGAGILSNPPVRLERQVVYYRLDAETVDDLLQTLPKLVEPDSWASTVTPGGELVPLNAEGLGTIRKVASGRRVINLSEVGKKTKSEESTPADGVVGSSNSAANMLVVPQAVLIIEHHPAVHRQISWELRHILSDSHGDFVGSGVSSGHRAQWMGERSGFGSSGGFY